MEEPEIRAVEMTRRIRAEHAEKLAGASPAERIRFYREKAQSLHRATKVAPSSEKDSG